MSAQFHIKYFLLLFIFIPLRIFSQEYISTSYSTEQGLPQEYIYSILQDSSGYLWIGTGAGVASFNGFEFKKYTVNDSLADDFVTAGFSTSKGQFFGHMSGDISVFSNGKFEKIIPEIVGKSAITSIAQGPDGRIWASSFSSGLILLSHKTRLPIYKIRDDRMLIASFYFLTTQDILIGSTRGLYHGKLTSTNEIEIIYHYKDIPEDKIQSIVKRKDAEGFYVATQNEGIYYLSFKDSNPEISRIDSKIEAWISNVQTIFEDSRQNLWIGTFGYGMVKTQLNPRGELELLQDFNSELTEGVQNVKTIFEDREENIWIGNYGEGLIRLKYKTYFSEEFDAEEYGNNILTIHSGNKYRWLGTEKGLIEIDRATSEVLNFYSSEELSSGKITSLYSENDKVLYIGTEWNGVIALGVESGRTEILKYTDGNLEKGVKIITGSDNYLWIGTQKGLCEIDKHTLETKWYTIQTAGLPHNTINHLYFDSKERLWIATQSSVLCYLEDKELTKVNIPSGNGTGILYSIVEDTANNIWIGTQGNGVYFIQPDSIMNLTTNEGLLSDYCYSLISDKKGCVWIGHRKGLSKLNTYTLSVKAISKINSKPIDYDFNPNSSEEDNEGVIWFGHNKGLLQYRPALENLKNPPPKLAITRIKINDTQTTTVEERLVLKPGRYKIQFEFIGVSLKSPDLVKYQYMLEGYDDDWSDIDYENTASYQRLIEGRYRFKVNAASGDGIITPNPVEVTIIIKAPVWKQAWFYMVLLLILVLLIYGYIKRREYKLNEEKRILEQRVQERTREIQRQKNEIQNQRDVIELKNKDITDSIRYASRIQSAIMPPADLLNDLLSEHFIINKPRDIVSGDFIWFAEKNDKIVVTVTDCTGHGVPGAIMSMLGISSLNEIVSKLRVLKANIILDELRDKVISALNQQNRENPTYDGMSLSLIVIDKKKKYFEYAGAYNNLIYYSDYEQKILYADRIPIGVSYMNEKKYKSQKVEYKSGDILYLYSDGYQDQFGGANDKKFTSRRLKQTFFTIHQLPLSDQKKILEETLSDWMQEKEQTDDITIMGIRF